MLQKQHMLLHLDCLDPVGNEQCASWPFLPNTTGTFTFSTHQKWSSLTYLAHFTLLHDCNSQSCAETSEFFFWRTACYLIHVTAEVQYFLHRIWSVFGEQHNFFQMNLLADDPPTHLYDTCLYWLYYPFVG